MKETAEPDDKNEEDKTMTKYEAIKTLQENGIFTLTEEIIGIIHGDNDNHHTAANNDLEAIINRVNQMQSGLKFDWKVMIDLTTQAYGFVKFAAYNELDVCADVVDQIEDLHDLLWNNFSSMQIWNG